MSASENSSTTTIYLLRHGLPEGEACFRGHTDFAITRDGLKQMDMATRHLNCIDHVVTSPLKRCADFAQHLASDHQVSVEENPLWMEIDFGDWDGQSKDDIWTSYQPLLTQFWSDPWKVTPPNGEPLELYDQRIANAWKQLLKTHQGKFVLVVTHGGVIKQLLRQLLEMPKNNTYLQRITVPYAALVTISVYHDEQGRLWPQVCWSSQESR